MCVCCLQVMSHVAAAQSASMVFLCVHRENYDFMEALAHQLSHKVPPLPPSPPRQTLVNKATMLTC